MQDRADPHARERALAVASQDPPSGVAPDEAVAEVRDVLASIGDNLPGVPARLRPAPSGAKPLRFDRRTVQKTGELRIGHTRSGATGISLDLNRWLGNFTAITLLRPDRPPRPRRRRDRAENRGARAPVFAGLWIA